MEPPYENNSFFLGQLEIVQTLINLFLLTSHLSLGQKTSDLKGDYHTEQWFDNLAWTIFYLKN